MDVKLSVSIGSPTNNVDMQNGLETLKGTSDVATITCQAILDKKVPKKMTKKAPVRANMKNNFKGSYAVNFDLKILNEKQLNEYREIGENVLIELLTYYINEALYLPTSALSNQAMERIAELEPQENDLIERLRNPLIAMHKICLSHSYAVRLDHKNNLEGDQIVRLTEETALNLTQLKKSQDVETFYVVITRFNSFTGNGRLVIAGEEKTTAFGFGSDFKGARYEWKKMISQNLDKNNSRPEEKWVYLEITAQRMIR